MQALRRCGAEASEVRTPAELAAVEGVVLPGGESTTMGILLDTTGLREPLAERIRAGLPVFGTCAGLILLAAELEDGVEGQRTFSALDVTARRNGYGRQVRSFEGDVRLAGDPVPLRGVFIRAPRLTRIGAEVEVIAELDGEPVAVRAGSIMAATFHPELTGDDRLHARFLAGLDT